MLQVQEKVLVCHSCKEKVPILLFSRSQQKRLKQGRSCYCVSCVAVRQEQEKSSNPRKQRPVPFSGEPGTRFSVGRRRWYKARYGSWDDWSYFNPVRHSGRKRKPAPQAPKYRCSECHLTKPLCCFDRKARKARRRSESAVCHQCDPNWSERPKRLASSDRSRRRGRKIPKHIEFAVDFAVV